MTESPVIAIPSRWVLTGSFFVSLLIGALPFPLPISFLLFELFLTIFALFLFGSIRYRIDKNALTYGALLIIFATFYPHSPIKAAIASDGISPFLGDVLPRLLSLTFLETILHLDTMLFILGLTFFVNVIAQTRMLETISMQILHWTGGSVFKTVLIIITLVSIASGIMDGVSMVGLTIRVLVFILIMAKVPPEDLKFITAVTVMVTCICGIWLAYGEPPNLIMKSNLGLPDSFFLIYAMPMAVITLILISYFLYQRLKSAVIVMNDLDPMEDRIADVRFYQAMRGAEVLESKGQLKTLWDGLGKEALMTIEKQRDAAALWGKIAFLPFIALLIGHAKNHAVPLFLSSVVAFFVAMAGMLPYPKIRRNILHEAVEEYKEYLFLFPLFLSIAMLSEVGLFDMIKAGIVQGVMALGKANMAAIQFIGSALLSAVLDNNVVADFASRAIVGLPDLLLFSAAQIAGYATGGALTHIGSAQSVIAYAYILRHIDCQFTPFQWVQMVWKLIGTILLALTGALYLIAYVLG
jgi:Na+/H+ antiporter NhaD/arsenite permease-like protein